MTTETLKQWFFSVLYDYQDPLDRRRALALILFSLLATAMSLLALPFVISANVEFQGLIFQRVEYTLLTIPALSGVVHFLVQTGRLRPATLLTVAYSVLAALLIVRTNGILTPALVAVMVPVVLAGLLLERTEMFITTLLITIATMTTAVVEIGSLVGVFTSGLALPFALLFLMSLTLFIFGGDVSHIARQKIRDVERFKAVSGLAGQISRHTDEQSIYTYALELIRRDLGHSFAQVFLVDEQRLLTRRRRMGEDDIVSDIRLPHASGLIEAQRKRVPVHISFEDQTSRRSHFLPASAYGIACPVIVDDEVVAVLDIQSDDDLFEESDLALLNALAEQLGTALEAAHTVRALQELVADREAVVDALRQQVQELKHSAEQVVGDVWDAYFERRGRRAIGFDADTGSGEIIPAYDIPQPLAAVLARGEPHIETHDSEQLVMMPLLLRGEVLGALAFSLPPDLPVNERQLRLMRSVSSRLALALDNKRLLEQNEARVVRERTANEITSLLIGATEIDSVMSLAAESFNDMLGAINTRVYLRPEAMTGPASAAAGSEHNGGTA